MYSSTVIARPLDAIASKNLKALWENRRVISTGSFFSLR